MPVDTRAEIREYLAASASAFMALSTDARLLSSIVQAAEVINDAFVRGNKLCIAGNGGSCADADHFAAELVGRYNKGDGAREAVSFSSAAAITAIGNDFSFEEIFVRMLEAHSKKGDVFFAISTSGNSKNILRGLEAAKVLGVQSIGLLGDTGAATAPGVCDVYLRMPATHTPHVQELHLAVMHAICECLER